MPLWCDNALWECWKNTQEACKILHTSPVFFQHPPRALLHHNGTRLVFYFLTIRYWFTNVFHLCVKSAKGTTRFFHSTNKHAICAFWCIYFSVQRHARNELWVVLSPCYNILKIPERVRKTKLCVWFMILGFNIQICIYFAKGSFFP